MTSFFGDRIKTTIFGESHGKAIGLVIDGLPPGEKIDMEELGAFLKRRVPGQTAYTSSRQEEDQVEFLSGLVDGKTSGSPLSAIIWNKDIRPLDYENILDLPRPSHADYNAYIKYKGHMDMRGGGPFSGRLTAPLAVAGGIALQILERRGVYIGAHLAGIGPIKDQKWDYINPSIESIKAVGKKDFPVISDEKGNEMKKLILSLKEEGDSIGGEIECMALGLAIGIGQPNYNGLESALAKILFAIPGVKGLAFGSGFSACQMKGSNHNDPYEVVEGKVRTKTNHSGGVVGGMTNGMPMYFNLAIKATPSISKVQKSFSIKEMEEKDLIIEGRHDPCIAIRALPVVEAVCGLTILDLWEAGR